MAKGAPTLLMNGEMTFSTMESVNQGNLNQGERVPVLAPQGPNLQAEGIEQPQQEGGVGPYAPNAPPYDYGPNGPGGAPNGPENGPYGPGYGPDGAPLDPYGPGGAHQRGDAPQGAGAPQGGIAPHGGEASQGGVDPQGPHGPYGPGYGPDGAPLQPHGQDERESSKDSIAQMSHTG
ncbi:hypothetical protein ANCCEY_14658 [Ancylostoma ceylanicum]|uniref:Uncharacterized protein n=1 Tax=Ancylostoma ceylanicum TaxID=53326 RepID=A0A0D6L998_9BILA|nr:hypothetical protein ANCCEY_14658 [Ancylostoma ceylanicum]